MVSTELATYRFFSSLECEKTAQVCTLVFTSFSHRLLINIEIVF